METRHILRNVLFFFRIAFKCSLDISKFTAPGPLGHYTFLHRINTFGEKNSNKKCREREKLILRKQL